MAAKARRGRPRNIRKTGRSRNNPANPYFQQRNKTGMSIEEVAGRVECSASFIRALENGSRKPGPKLLEKLCLLFGCTADELLTTNTKGCNDG